jgi:hypothetical protein
VCKEIAMRKLLVAIQVTRECKPMALLGPMPSP